MAARLMRMLGCLAARRAVVAVLCLGMLSGLFDFGAHAHRAARSLHAHDVAVAATGETDGAHHDHSAAGAPVADATHQHDDGTADHRDCGDEGGGCASHAHCCWSALALPAAALIVPPAPQRLRPGRNEHSLASQPLLLERPPIAFI
jgi:hypothetical protein